jgi:hypothetical protein
MSQILVQEKKLLTLKDIAPQWYNKLLGKESSEQLNWSIPSQCIVGEAHGFSGEYSEYCSHFCGRFISVVYDENKKPKQYTEQELNNHPIVKDFVQHWNEVHVK